jgi:nucleoside-diphosphate-sugar epimerase
MISSNTNPLAEDLEHILEHTRDLWEEIRGQRVFITGGTGFFGCWLLESFAWANDTLALDAEICVLTRNYEAFTQKAPHLTSNAAITFHIGDVQDFDFPSGQFSHVIHAATETNVKLDSPSPLKMFEASVEGTRHTLHFACACNAKKFLFISSGAVYGKQPSEIMYIPEDYVGAADITDLTAAYGNGKRAAEFMALAYADQFDFSTKIARCFAFVGPYQPLDSGFAIGNFIGDALHGKPIKIKGDGTPCRSYLYAADLAIWLWTILLRGEPGRPYNVGSEEQLSIEALASMIAGLVSGIQVNIAKTPMPGKRPERYAPATIRARSELGLDSLIQLPEAIKRTIQWHKNRA